VWCKDESRDDTASDTEYEEDDNDDDDDDDGDDDDREIHSREPRPPSKREINVN